MKTDFLYCIFEAHSMPGDNVPGPDVLSTLYNILFLFLDYIQRSSVSQEYPSNCAGTNLSSAYEFFSSISLSWLNFNFLPHLLFFYLLQFVCLFYHGLCAISNLNLSSKGFQKKILNVSAHKNHYHARCGRIYPYSFCWEVQERSQFFMTD